MKKLTVMCNECRKQMRSGMKITINLSAIGQQHIEHVHEKCLKEATKKLRWYFPKKACRMLVEKREVR